MMMAVLPLAGCGGKRPNTDMSALMTGALSSDAASDISRLDTPGQTATSEQAKADRLVREAGIALETGDVAAARQTYARAVQLAPESVRALSGLGVAEDLAHQHDAAQAEYRRALQLAPNDWGLRSNLAVSLVMSNRPDDAVAALRGADHDPDAPRRARHDLALALTAAGQREGAVRVLQGDVPDAEAEADKFAAFSRWLCQAGQHKVSSGG
jgi:Flp pilus assembly protein TadD